MVLKPFEAPSTATSVGAIFSETNPSVRPAPTTCYIRQYIQLKKSSLVKGSKSSRLGGIEVDASALYLEKQVSNASITMCHKTYQNKDTALTENITS